MAEAGAKASPAGIAGTQGGRRVHHHANVFVACHARVMFQVEAIAETGCRHDAGNLAAILTQQAEFAVRGGVQVSGSISHSSGVNPAHSAACAVAANVNEGISA